ncbi:MAG: hypothetical protein DYH13_09055 [Alphaproteobacteria bacterium PRO2]|nr:hypothetical protein [Alphaproteobacteria bacterium PRO2]
MGEGRKFHIAEGLSRKFGSASAKGGLSAVVEAANNFLGMFDAQTDEDVKRLLVNAATNPGSVTSIMATSYTPNFDPVEERKKEEEAFWDRMQALQKQLDEYNKHISDLIDECNKMAEQCLERMREIKKQIANNNERIAEYEKAHKRIAEEARKFERNGSFERGADGKLANKDAQKALDAYTQRTGEKPEKDSDIYQALLKQIQFEQEEMRRLREKNEELDVEHETLRVQRDEILERAKELTEERNRINNDPNLMPEQKVAQIKEMWERERENNEVLIKAWDINDQSVRNEIDNVRSVKSSQI